MSAFKRFDLKNLDDLRAALDQRGLELPISNNLAVLGEKVALAGHTLPNRFVVQPMEGVDGDPVTGAPGELTLRRYRRFASGGSGLIWAESVAVVPEGASGARQMWVTRDNLDAYKRLLETTRQSALKEAGHAVTCVVQLTHSGRYSRPGGVMTPLKAQDNPTLDHALGMAELKPVSDDYLMRLQDSFVDAARLLSRAGFDGIDMKAVHGYLVAELLGAHQREGRFGGSYENRTRFLRECVQRMMEELPASCFVTTRMTVLEPSQWPYGWGVAERSVNGEEMDGEAAWTLDLSEPKRLMRELAGLGMPLFNVSMGYPRFQPYMNRPHDNPLAGKAAPPEYPLDGVVRFQQIAREMQRSCPELPLVTAGLAWLRQLIPQVAAGLIEQGWCTLIGQGRGAFAYPGSVQDILGYGLMDTKKCCITCSLCSQIMADGVGRGGCPVRDKDIYGPELVKGRNLAKQKEGKR